MKNRKFYTEIFLVSLAAIVLEISFTRIFSYKLYYYFTYLIIGIAMLGLGSGGVLAAVSRRIRDTRPESMLTACALFAAALVPISYLIVATVQLNPIDFVEGYTDIAKLALLCGALFAPFLAVGIALAVLFGSFAEDMNRLYFFDLLGAGLGCALCVPLFTWFSPTAAIMLAGLCLAVAGTLAARKDGSSRIGIGAVLTLVLFGLSIGSTALPDPVPARSKTLSPQRLGDREILFSSWSALFRVDVHPQKGSLDDKVYIIAHDGNAGSGLHAFDGDFSKLGRFDRDIRLEPFSVLDDDPHVLIIGAAGGHEILASLHFGASQITAVELNPVTISLLRDDFADYTGRIAFHPKVDLINAEGRSFVQSSDDRYDLIWFVAPDSYAAMNAASSGAFVLSESYLFTVEMIKESLKHLTENGIVCVQWGELFSDRNRATRYLATAKAALAEMGFEDPAAHILLSTGPGMLPTSTIILRNEPFQSDEIASYREAMAAIPKTKLWHPTSGAERQFDHPMIKTLDLEGDELATWQAEHDYAVTPIRDDSPFFWHFTRFRDAFSRPPPRKSYFLGLDLVPQPANTKSSWREDKDTPNWELATGEQTLLILLCVATVFAGVFLLLPLVAVRDVWNRIPKKRYAFMYFSALGLGFMFYEVCLIQRLTLMLGYPTYSLTVTLFSLLIFSGLGSLVSDTYTRVLGRNRALASLFLVLVILTAFYLFGLGPLEKSFAAAAFPVRVALAALVLAPLGLCLGALMPIGVGAIASTTGYRREYVAWAWGVNGFFSVVSSVLSTILAMTIGFNLVLVIACTIYGLGMIALTFIPEQPLAAQRPDTANG